MRVSNKDGEENESNVEKKVGRKIRGGKRWEEKRYCKRELKGRGVVKIG